jgi:hypothetical protein
MKDEKKSKNQNPNFKLQTTQQPNSPTTQPPNHPTT